MTLENEYTLSFYRELTKVNDRDNIILVKHTESGRLYIKKRLRLYDRAVYDFIREYSPAGVPRIEAMVEEDGVLTIVEEYIAGDRLSEVLQARGPLSEEETLRIISQLCDILSVFHHQQPPIVHRDIKPENLILTADGNLKLLDFNAAKYTSEARDRDTVLIGTAGYAAPEQYGFSESTPATDIYAIGILMAEMLTGEKKTANVQGDLTTVMKTCTAMDPRDRYASVTELKQALTKRQSVPGTCSSWLPPGFRTKTGWKRIVAIIGYLLLLELAVTLQVEKAASAAVLTLNRICFGLMELSEVLLIFNYRGVQNRLPFAADPRLWLRTGSLLVYAAILPVLFAWIASLMEAVFV